MLQRAIALGALVGAGLTWADEPTPELIPVGPDKFLRWHGETGSTYFIQVSDTNELLSDWVLGTSYRDGQ